MGGPLLYRADAAKAPVSLRPLLAAALICAVLTLPAAWKAREYINPDGLSYIEVASNSLRLSSSYLFSNAYWSPAYPALIALTFRLARPPLAAELGVVHGLDWIICLATYLSYTWFLLNLLRWIGYTQGPVFGNKYVLYAIAVLSYALVLVSNVDPEVWYAGPNVLVEAIVFLAAGFCIRTALPEARLWHYAALGAALALAYAAKAVMFPLSLALLAILFIRPLAPGARRGVVLATAAFLAVSAPLIATLTKAKGRLTFGDAGTMNYAWRVNELHAGEFWLGQLQRAGAPLHRPAILSTSPLIVKFDSLEKASFPFWYDPSYWWEGVRIHFSPGEQIRIYKGSLGLDRSAEHDGVNVFELSKRWIPLFAGLGVLAFFRVSFVRAWRVIRGQAWLLAWPALAFLMFGSIVLEFRYVVPFAILAWTAALVAIGATLKDRKALWTFPAMAAALLLLASSSIVSPAARFALEKTGLSKPSPYARFTHAGLAAQLAKMGIRPGDELASLDFPMSCYYARLAGATLNLRVFMPDGPGKMNDSQIAGILDVLRANGAKAVVSLKPPPVEHDAGWVHVQDSALYVRLL